MRSRTQGFAPAGRRVPNPAVARCALARMPRAALPVHATSKARGPSAPRALDMRNTTFPIVSTLSALVLSAMPAFAGAPATPHLDHGAPFLGRALPIELSGAAPFVPVTLMLSPEAGHSSTPFGTLELRRFRIIQVASGTTDAQGNWSASLDIPLLAGLAEQEHHYQALVFDPAAPAGALFSDAFALRLLGSRIYAAYRDDSSVPAHTGLYIVDAIHGVVTAALDHGTSGAPPGSNTEGRPVFDSRFAVGAVMSSLHELVFFDAYFGTRLSSISFAGECSRVLFTDAGAARVYVLETGVLPIPALPVPATVHVVDLRTQSEIASLPLSNTSTRLWCVNRGAREAFVAEYDASARPALRRVDLVALQDRGALTLETAVSGSTFDRIAFALAQVFVTTHHFGPGPTASTQFSRVVLAPASMTLVASTLNDTYSTNFVALPGVDRLVGWTSRWSIPSASFFVEGLSSPGGVPGIPLPDFYVAANDFEDDGTRLWVLDGAQNEPGDPTEPGYLWRFDFTNGTWWRYPRNWPFRGPQDVERLHDALVDLVCISTTHIPPPIDDPGEVLLASPDGANEIHVWLGVTAEALLTVPVP